MEDFPILAWLILLTLSSARITHLVTTDSIAEPFRELFADHPWWDELLHCPWCAGAWISLAHTLLLTQSDNPFLFTLVTAAAISYAVGWLETRDS